MNSFWIFLDSSTSEGRAKGIPQSSSDTLFDLSAYKDGERERTRLFHQLKRGQELVLLDDGGNGLGQEKGRNEESEAV